MSTTTAHRPTAEQQKKIHSPLRVRRERPGAMVFIAAVAAMLLSVVTLATAEAQARSYHFDITDQTLSQALRNYGQISGQEIIFTEDLVAGVKATSLNGEYTAEAALDQLLKNTGLTAERAPSGALMIRRPQVPTAHAVAEETSPLHAREEGQGVMGLRLAQTEEEKTDSTSSASTDAKEDKAALEEILVTAEKRTESAQNLPIAISAFSAETLENRGIGGLESLQQAAPSLQVHIAPGNQTNVYMRGIGTDLSNIGGEPAVAMSQDGVAYASTHLHVGSFFDIERVEVLRGPQGTISGRNATAGAINTYSKRPTEELEGGIKTTLGNYDEFAVEGYLSGPVASDRLLGRLAVRTDRADGWVTNTLLGKKIGAKDTVNARAGFLARLSDSFEAHLILDAFRDRSDHLTNVDDGRIRPDVPSLAELSGAPGFDREAHTVQQDQEANFDVRKYQATLRLTWDLGPSARITTITGYVDHRAVAVSDLDGTAMPVIVLDPVDGIAADISQVSQEITLTADLTDRLDVILGALYLQNDQNRDLDFGLPTVGVPVGAAPFKADQKLNSWSGYTQWRYRPTNDIRLSAGVRYTHDSKSYADRSFFLGIPLFADADASWSAWTPRFAVDYAPSDDLAVYASISRGFKSGGYNTFTAPLNRFEPEYVWSYETGLKANWFEKRLKTALTGFHMNYTDLQQDIWGLDPGSITPRTVNANSATIQGVELEFDALITDRFRITAAGTWLDATYDELRSHDPIFPELGVLGPAGLNVRDLSGNQLVRAPVWQFNLSGEYTVPLSGKLRGVLRAFYTWQEKVYFDFYNHESVSQDAYGLVNLSGAIETGDGRWQLSAFVNNLTDKYYLTSEVAAGAGLAPVPFSEASPGRPRTYGLSIAYRF